MMIVFRALLLSILCLGCLGATSATARDLTPSEFEAYTTGKTLFFGRNGEAYGAERYLPNRRVIWSFLDGACKHGSWYAQGNDICFVYEDMPDAPQCWRFQAGPRGLIAQFLDSTPGAPLYEAQDWGDEMVCLGPEVGV